MRATNIVACSAKYSTQPQGDNKTVYPQKDPGYMYVNAEDDDPSMRGMSDRAAQTLFWTELARGFAVTLAHVFKVCEILFLNCVFKIKYLIL